MTSKSRNHRSFSRRLFRCNRCDHMLRLGSAECGSCCASTPFYNRKSTLLILPLLLAGLVFAFTFLSL